MRGSREWEGGRKKERGGKGGGGQGERVCGGQGESAGHCSI